MKKLLALALVLVFPLGSYAMMTPVFSVINSPSIAAGGTTFFSWGSGQTGGNGSSSRLAEGPVGAPGTVDNLYCNAPTPPSAGTTIVVTVFKNAVATGQTCTITSTGAIVSDSAHPFSVVAGDDIAYQAVSTSAAISSISVSNTFQGTNAGESTLSGSSGGTISATSYFGIQGGTTRTVEASSTVLAPTSFTLDQLHATTTSAAGVGNSFTYTLFKNDLATSLSCAISGSGSTSCTDTNAGHAVSYVASDTLAMQIAVGGAPVSKAQRWGMRLVPATDGETPIFANETVLSVGATRFPAPVGTSANTNTETVQQAIVPIAFTLKKQYVSVYPTPNAAHQWAFTSRKNAGAGNLSATVTAGNTLANDTVNSDSETAGDLFNWQSVVTAGTTALQVGMQSGVAYIAPATASGISQTIINGATVIFNGGVYNFL